jgi:GNAT superfamily N-acetyltransferase
VEIRLARPTDAGAVDAIVQRAYEPYVARIGSRPAPMDDDYEEKIARGIVFVIEEEVAIGAIVLIDKSDHLLIENVAVDPDRQGEGIGGALLAFAESRSRESGLDLLRLYTNAAMTESLSVYAHLGYREQDRRTDDGFDRIFLAKRL